MLSINNFNYFCASKFSTKIIREMKKIILIIMCLFVLACGNEPAVNAQTIKGNFLNKIAHEPIHHKTSNGRRPSLQKMNKHRRRTFKLYKCHGR